MFASTTRFVLRSLTITAILGSLVACTFDGSTDEDEGSTASNLGSSKKTPTKKDASAPSEESEDETEGAWGADGGDVEEDASTGWHTDGGAFSDGGVRGDGGAFSDGGRRNR